MLSPTAKIPKIDFLFFLFYYFKHFYISLAAIPLFAEISKINESPYEKY